jgi:hypothetical protein
MPLRRRSGFRSRPAAASGLSVTAFPAAPIRMMRPGSAARPKVWRRSFKGRVRPRLDSQAMPRHRSPRRSAAHPQLHSHLHSLDDAGGALPRDASGQESDGSEAPRLAVAPGPPAAWEFASAEGPARWTLTASQPSLVASPTGSRGAAVSGCWPAWVCPVWLFPNRPRPGKRSPARPARSARRASARAGSPMGHPVLEARARVDSAPRRSHRHRSVPRHARSAGSAIRRPLNVRSARRPASGASH